MDEPSTNDRLDYQYAANRDEDNRLYNLQAAASPLSELIQQCPVEKTLGCC